MTSQLNPSLPIAPDSFITLHYRLSHREHDIVNTFAAQPATLTLGEGLLAPALEAVLLGLSEGDRKVFQIKEGLAFGERHADKVQWVAGSLLDELDAQGGQVYQVGDIVQFPGPGGAGEYAGAVLAVSRGVYYLTSTTLLQTKLLILRLRLWGCYEYHEHEESRRPRHRFKCRFKCRFRGEFEPKLCHRRD